MMTSPARPPAVAFFLLLIALLSVAAVPAASGDGGPYRLTQITYLTGSSIYVGAGSDDGIAIGQVLEVVRSEEVVALIKVTYVSSRRALCEKVSGDLPLAAGDTVRFVARATPPAPDPAPPEADRAPDPGRGRDIGIHGRIGVRYLVVRDNLEGGATFSQPALDVRLDGTSVGGAPIDLTVDARSRTTYRTMADGERLSDNLTSVYRAAVSWRDQNLPWRITLGRQISPSLAAVSIFDGVEAAYRGRRFGAGVFSGTQPDPEDLGYSSTVREHGGYVEVRNAPGADRRWAITTGLIGSYEESEISREYSYLQGSYQGPRLSAWIAEEVDLNRGWKSEFEGESVSLTSTLVSLSLRATEGLTFNAGYDNRRNVRLYRDRVTPETEFDDEYRNGAWAGVTWRFAGHFSIGVDGRSNSGGTSGSADSATLRLAATRLTPIGIDLRSRSTRYENDQVEGWLHSISMGLPIGSRVRVEAIGGLRDETNLADPLLSDQVAWYGLDLDVNFGRRWYAIASVERARGDREETDQAYLSIAWRF